jgi:hypothetical protein
MFDMSQTVSRSAIPKSSSFRHIPHSEFGIPHWSGSHTFSIYTFSNISFWRYKQKNCRETLPLIVNSSKETCCEKFWHPGCPKASALMGGQFPPHFSLFFHFNKIQVDFNFI